MVRFDRLKDEQLKLSRKTILKDSPGGVKTLGGADCAFSENKIIAAVIVCGTGMEIIDKAYSVMELKMPNVPEFTFYREGPAIADAYSKLDKRPDVLMVEGNGILHPWRIGIATQLGILLDQATIGISQSLLIGTVEEGNIIVGNEIRGAEMKTREYARPLYVSAGHKVSIQSSIELVRKAIRPPHKLPEPLHLAHKYAKSVRKGLQ